MFSPKDALGVRSGYQTFMERSRYLRRGDYALSNQLMAPLVFEEIGASQNYALRAMTSLIRHHTVAVQPMIGYIHNGELLNGKEIGEQMKTFLASARRLAAARLAKAYEKESSRYRPVGYVLSANKEEEDVRLNSRKKMVKSRYEHMLNEAKDRLIP
jgi:hypothetical protein